MADQIVLSHVTKRFTTKTLGDIVAVDDFNLNVHEGECFSFLGPSGCGKSTTLRMIAGFEDLTEGEIELCGKLVSSSRKNLYIPPEERGLGMVFQAFAVWPHMNVFENVAFPLRIQKVNKTDIVKRVNEALHHTSLTGLEKVFPGDLSGGQQQRIALARAMVIEPDVLLMDEPLSNLDAKLRVKMRVEIRRLQQELGFTAIYVTHDQEECFAISDQVAIMNGGVIEQMDTPAHIFNAPKTEFIAHFVGFENFFRLTRVSGQLTAENGTPMHVALDRSGDAFTGCIRPEDVQILPPGSNALNGIPGEVLVSTFLGRTVQYNVRTAIGEFVVKADQSQVYPLGASVLLELSANKIILINPSNH